MAESQFEVGKVCVSQYIIFLSFGFSRIFGSAVPLSFFQLIRIPKYKLFYATTIAFFYVNK